MRQLRLQDLLPKPTIDDKDGSTRTATAAPEPTRVGSARSQVRALLADVCTETTERAVGARVSSGAPDLDRAALAANDGAAVHIKMRSTADRIRKRTLRRAMKRAEQSGTATYRGRPLKVDTSGYDLPPRRPITNERWQPERVKVIHWNAGGFSQEVQMEWFTWLRQDKSVGIFTIAETHWNFTNDYQKEGWLIVHSGMEGRKGGGVMVGVRADLVEANTMRWQVLEAGRLLHVRCQIRQQHYDIVTMYQHALAHLEQDQQKELMRKCRKLWKQAEALLSGFPFRSAILMTGDLNMTLSPLSEVAGHGIKLGSDLNWLVQERDEVMSMLKEMRLVALNTWGKPDITYHHPNGTSQIDYILVRRQCADSKARECKTLAAPIAGWRSSGHKPLQASLKLNWKPWCNRIRNQRLEASAMRPVQEVLSSYHVELSELQQAVKHQWDMPITTPQLPATKNVDANIAQLWHLALPVTAEVVQGGVRSIWSAWRDQARKNRIKREMRQLARQRKRVALLEALELISQSQQEGDVRTQYQLIRRLCPKTYRRKICLRSTDGFLMSGAEECQELAKYATELFSDVCFDAPEVLCLPESWFAPHKWVEALKSLSGRKAVPKFSASVEAWKDHAEMLAPTLAQIAKCTVCAGQPYVPEHWMRVQLAWMPKPGRAPTSPDLLRSIGLMSPDTKAFLVLLKRQADPWVQKALAKYPQYAYRQRASTVDPLLRATHHCATVRQQLAGYVDDQTSRLLHHQSRELLGGIMIGIDLSKAFDLLRYEEMLQALRDTGMPEELCRILVHVHIHTILTVEHAGSTQEVRMRRGLRQGCSVAPMIYACWTVRLCKLIDAKMKNQASENGGASSWSQAHLSVFADDKHSFWEVGSVAEFDKAIRQLQQIIEVIQSLGMCINFQKSVATVALKGTQAQKIMKRHFKQWDGRKCLIVRTSGQDIKIPITDTMPYLGCMLSYGNFELTTAMHRCKQATSNFAQLRKVLRTNSMLSKAQRLSVYRTCVWPALLYGITAVGFSSSSCRTLQSTAAMHLRKVLRLHERGLTNEQVLDQAGLPLLLHLERRVERQEWTMTQDQARAPELRCYEEHRQRHIQQQIQALRERGFSQQLTMEDPSAIVQLPCPVCGLYFATPEGLHQHLHERHPEIEQAAKIPFNRAQHSLFGLPYCRFCRCRQGSWQSLIKHVTQGACLRIKDAVSRQQTIDQLMEDIRREEERDPPRAPPGCKGVLPTNENVVSVRSMVINTRIADMQRHSLQLISFANQCLLCGQILQKATSTKSHWRQSHPEAWQRAHRLATSEAQSLSALVKRPCQFCASQAKDYKLHARQCPMLFQILAVRTLDQESSGSSAQGGTKQAAPRKTEVEPKYRSFVSPLQCAFAKATSMETARSCSALLEQKDPQAPSNSSRRVRTIASTQQAQLHAGTIKQFFAVRQDDTRRLLAPNTPLPWTCKVKLRNPHSLCYVNAAILAIMHALRNHIHPGHSLQFLAKVGEKAAQRDVPLHLPQMNLFRKLVPSWTYDAQQQDTAEFIHHLASNVPCLQVLWDCRCRTPEGIRLHSQGAIPIPLEMSEPEKESTTLQALVDYWSSSKTEAGDITALTYPYPWVCLQLGRYRPAGKLMQKMDLPDHVQLPVFSEDSTVHWLQCYTKSAIIHLGRLPTAGHYRALLKVESFWYLADDAKTAEMLNLHAGHRRNLYVVVLGRQQHEPVASPSGTPPLQ
eukprot:s432_g16.t1